MTSEFENEEEALAKRRKDEDEGDSDSFGRGKAGAGSTVAKLSPHKLKEVMANWRELDAAALIEVLTEFFTEGPLRASANVVVNWTKTQAFAIVNWTVETGQKLSDIALTRERTRGRDATGLQRKNPNQPKTKPGMAMNLGPAGPTGQ